MYTTKDKHEEKKENTVTLVYKKVQYTIESLQNESTKFLYQQRLNNKLNRVVLEERPSVHSDALQVQPDTNNTTCCHITTLSIHPNVVRIIVILARTL